MSTPFSRVPALGLLLLAACAPTASNPPANSPTEPTPHVVTDPAVTGAALRVEPVIDGSSVTVRLVAQQLGHVFGLSYHLRYDATRLELEAPSADAQPGVLGPDAFMVLRPGAGDVALGGTRRDPRQGEAEIADGTTLATLRFRVLQARSARLDVERVMVRRADGAFTTVGVQGALLEEVRP
ncbi:MAG: hypothetical protein AB2A00_14925 [Myxococcota bacterium]